MPVEDESPRSTSLTSFLPTPQQLWDMAPTPLPGLD